MNRMNLLKEYISQKHLIDKLVQKFDTEEIDKMENIEFIFEEQESNEISDFLSDFNTNSTSNNDEESKEEIICIMKRKANYHSFCRSNINNNHNTNNYKHKDISSPRPVRLFKKNFF